MKYPRDAYSLEQVLGYHYMEQISGLVDQMLSNQNADCYGRYISIRNCTMIGQRIFFLHLVFVLRFLLMEHYFFGNSETKHWGKLIIYSIVNLLPTNYQLIAKQLSINHQLIANTDYSENSASILSIVRVLPIYRSFFCTFKG